MVHRLHCAQLLHVPGRGNEILILVQVPTGKVQRQRQVAQLLGYRRELILL
jgi:hypothetical protein